MKYLKVWTDFEKVLKPLQEDEIGRLFLDMLRYAGTGEEPEDFIGNEEFLWEVAKRDIDMAAERAETLRNNGLKGGRPKTKENQEKPTETKENQYEPIGYDTKPDESRKEKKRNEKKGNETEISFIADEEAHKIQKEHDSILEAAKNAGFKGSPSENADLIKLYAEYGYEKVIAGFTACVEHSAANLAYLRAVLKGEPRKQVVTQTRVLPAQNFEQRDYSGVDDELKAKLAAEMAEFKRNGGLQNAAG